MPRTPANSAATFWSRVDKTGDCWLWTGPTTGKPGYGSFCFQGKSQTAHRVSYLLSKGPIPPGMVVCHSCDVRLCVNPAHLSVGTQKQNIQDASTKGRLAKPKSTHCPRGHEFTPANTLVSNRGRICRICKRQKERNNRYIRLGRPELCQPIT